MEEKIEHEVDTINQWLENGRQLLTEEQLAEIDTSVSEFREMIVVNLQKYYVKEAEEYLQRYESLLQNESDYGDRGRAEAYARNCQACIGRPRLSPQRRRTVS